MTIIPQSLTPFQSIPALTEKPDHKPAIVEGSLQLPTCWAVASVTEAMQNAASGAKAWEVSEGSAPTFINQSKGNAKSPSNKCSVEYGRKDNMQLFTLEEAQQLHTGVLEFTDQDCDVFLYGLSALTRCTGPIPAAEIWADDFLNSRGLKQIKGGADRHDSGHREEDRRKIGESLWRISQLFITIDERYVPIKGKNKWKERRYTAQCPVWTINGTWSSDDVDKRGNTSNHQTLAWQIVGGRWVQEYKEDERRFIHTICAQTLKYDPLRQRWAKRIGLHVIMQLQFNKMQPITRNVESILQECSLEGDARDPERTIRKPFEEAIKQLAKDGVIGCAIYQTEQDKLPARNWLPIWKQWNVTIYPKNLIPSSADGIAIGC